MIQPTDAQSELALYTAKTTYSVEIENHFSQISFLFKKSLTKCYMQIK